MLLAVDRFDLVNETRLATYAVWWIRQAIQRAVAAGAYPVRLNPRQLHYLAQAQDSTPTTDWARRVQPERPSSNPAQTLERLLAATRPAISLDAPGRADGTDNPGGLPRRRPERRSLTPTTSATTVGTMLKSLTPGNGRLKRSGSA